MTAGLLRRPVNGYLRFYRGTLYDSLAKKQKDLKRRDNEVLVQRFIVELSYVQQLKEKLELKVKNFEEQLTLARHEAIATADIKTASEWRKKSFALEQDLASAHMMLAWLTIDEQGLINGQRTFEGIIWFQGTRSIRRFVRYEPECPPQNLKRCLKTRPVRA